MLTSRKSDIPVLLEGMLDPALGLMAVAQMPYNAAIQLTHAHPISIYKPRMTLR